MLYSLILALSLVLFAANVQAQSLLDALKAANASGFAQYVQDTPGYLAALSAPGVQTIFAPTDEALAAFTSNTTVANSLRRRQGVNMQAEYQSSSQGASAAQLALPPGLALPMNLPSSENKKQVTVSQPKSSSSNTTSKKLKSRQQVASPVILFSGLGRNVTIVKEDTPFSGGLIQTVDGQTNLTGFSTGLQTANLTSMLNSPVGMTIFSITNEGYQTGAGNITSPTALSGLLSNHIVPNFLGYLPLLTNGLVLRTQAGTTLTVSVRNGQTYINNALIVSPNLITANGVSHVLNQILVPDPIPFTGAGISLYPSTQSLIAAGILSLLVLSAV
ncbi:hypothetical protein MMC11_008759 [Xylographa trunciseda]|nr:hypothetical protein [Xylographa trunciseda]